MNPSLFQRLLGAEFYHLSDAVKALHARQGRFAYRGRCTVERERNPLGRIACAVMRLPRAMNDAPLRVMFAADGMQESWQRDFGGLPMRSRLQRDGARLRERLGPMTFRFRLYRRERDLHWIAEQAKLFGIVPLPARWLDGIRCREYAEGDRYAFEVEARLPLFGRLVRYHGWLRPEDEADHHADIASGQG